MKIKYLLPLIFFIGCANNNINISKNINETSKENLLLQKYQISKNDLIKIGDNYFFISPDNNGTAIYKLDLNYNLLQRNVIPILLDSTFIVGNGKNIFLIGFNQIKQKPEIVILDKNLNIKKEKYFANKFDIPKDAILNENRLTILLLTYKNGADFEIYSNNKLKIFKQKYNQLPKFIRKFNNGYIVTGSIQHPQEDIFITFIKDNKIVWQKIINLGMSDSPLNIKIKNNKIIINAISQDYMGAETYFNILIDKNGKILKIDKKLDFEPLPTKFRT